MTKYFELQDTPELKYAPRIKNLFGKLDIRDIQLKTYPKLPERLVLFVEPSEKTYLQILSCLHFYWCRLLCWMSLRCIRMYVFTAR